MSEFESDFGGGQYSCACIAIGYQQYTLHSQIDFVPPSKLGRSLVYPINPTHGSIAVVDQKYKNLHDYHLVKNINSFLKKIIFIAIGDQWIKGAKVMVMGYDKKSFFAFMYWL